MRCNSQREHNTSAVDYRLWTMDSTKPMIKTHKYNYHEMDNP